MTYGLIIPIFNRPQYLQKCFEHLKSATYPSGTTIVLIDDCSTDTTTKELFNSFSIEGVEVVKIIHSKNTRVSGALLTGYDYCIFKGFDYIINLDSDAIVKPDFILKLKELHDKYPNTIVTGFNCLTRNKDGSERHKVVGSGEGYNFKATVGGINMFASLHTAKNIIYPELKNCSIHGGNWDHKACLSLNKSGLNVACIVPSVVQHIGVESSLGHHENPDIADDFDKKDLELPMVTIVGVDCVNIDRLIKVVDESCKNISFGDVKILSSIKNSRATRINPIRNIKEYSQFMIRELHKFIDTDYCLVVQHDGYVVNHKAWSDEFLKYDYIGATWWYKDNMNVGNGGFSLRSKKLLKELSIMQLKTTHPEDDVISRQVRKQLELKGIIFPPEEVANRFSIEAYGCPAPSNKYNGQFGFHGYNVDFEGSGVSPINKPAQTNRRFK